MKPSAPNSSTTPLQPPAPGSIRQDPPTPEPKPSIANQTFTMAPAKNQIAQPPSPQLGLQWRYMPTTGGTGNANKSAKIVIEISQLLICDGPVSAQQITVTDPLYQNTRVYEGYLLGEILAQISNGQKFKAIQFTAEDGYRTPPIPLNSETGAGFLAIADHSQTGQNSKDPLWDNLPPKKKDGSPRGTPKNRTPGPAYLVWPDGHPNHDNTNYWPYQVRTIELIP